MRYLLIFTTLIISACSYPPKGINVELIDENGIKAKLISKKENSINPIVLVLTGSSGAYFKPKYVYGLVNQGYDVLSLAYFGIEGLPATLEEIPLEYLNGAVNWTKEKLRGGKRGIVLMGPSRGAEFILLYASYFHDIEAVIAYSPSCLVIPEAVFNQNPQGPKSSWTLRGRGFPFAPLATLPKEGGPVNYKKIFQPLLDSQVVLDSASIPVEQIECPVLLMSGEDDQVWPSAKMASIIETKIKSSDNQMQVINKVYPNTGHQFLFFDEVPPNKPRTYQSLRLNGKKYQFPFGGTEEGIQKAMLDSQKDVLSFLSGIKK